jgi:hypothetical protein
MTVPIRSILRYSLLVLQILLLIPIGWFLVHLLRPRA